MTVIRSIDLATDSAAFHAAAEILVDAFHGISTSWQTPSDAGHALREISEGNVIFLGAYRNEHLVGCIGATAQYGGHAWELHPLAVAPRHARKGVGTALIQSLCNSLLERGACTLFAWCDDETASTSLGGVDVYPDPLIAVSTLVSGPRHAGGFYLKNHFRLTGILPDANGFGKPDLLYVRRIAPVI